MVNPLGEESSPSDKGTFWQQPNDDAALLARAQAGESAAKMALYDRYLKFVYWLCFGAVHNREDAEDLTQETWHRAFASLASAPPASFHPWLARIAKNLITDHYRRQQRRPVEPLTDGETLYDPDLSPEECVLRQEKRAEARAQVLPLLARLNAGQRLTLILSHVDDLPDDEIARIMGKASADAVAQQRHRGLKKIRDWLHQNK
jgi:RNA polymerase sigma-70 factor (ECF subfamily)